MQRWSKVRDMKADHGLDVTRNEPYVLVEAPKLLSLVQGIMKECKPPYTREEIESVMEMFPEDDFSTVRNAPSGSQGLA